MTWSPDYLISKWNSMLPEDWHCKAVQESWRGLERSWKPEDLSYHPGAVIPQLHLESKSLSLVIGSHHYLISTSFLVHLQINSQFKHYTSTYSRLFSLSSSMLFLIQFFQLLLFYVLHSPSFLETQFKCSIPSKSPHPRTPPQFTKAPKPLIFTAFAWKIWAETTSTSYLTCMSIMVFEMV